MPAAPKKTLARGWVFEIQAADGLTWIQLGGVHNFSNDRDKNDADTTDFNSEGKNEHLPASRGRSLSLDVFYLEDPATATFVGDRDPGQERWEAMSDLVGPEGIGLVRWTSPAGNKWEAEASFNASAGSGGNDDPTDMTYEATVSGAVTYTPNAA